MTAMFWPVNPFFLWSLSLQPSDNFELNPIYLFSFNFFFFYSVLKILSLIFNSHLFFNLKKAVLYTNNCGSDFSKNEDQIKRTYSITIHTFVQIFKRKSWWCVLYIRNKRLVKERSGEISGGQADIKMIVVSTYGHHFSLEIFA